MYKRYVGSIAIIHLPFREEVFIERGFLGNDKRPLVNVGLLNPYFLGIHGLVIDYDLSLTKKHLSPCFPYLGEWKTLRESQFPIGGGDI